ncbi:hypothetical protein WICPIJ_001293 [Wickerhamomyces pijperi]|uniref:Uncharacterized protein n=1 Tax=Wickerhamomyces pijperi TaxID=599730 RepID=A0A9P8QBW3_WICPI|nr:hypothetical protein WICPIJ_001293 [Wickerhamomyces pijperi]
MVFSLVVASVESELLSSVIIEEEAWSDFFRMDFCVDLKESNRFIDGSFFFLAPLKLLFMVIEESVLIVLSLGGLPDDELELEEEAEEAGDPDLVCLAKLILKCLRSSRLAPLTGDTLAGVSLIPLELILEGEPNALAILEGGEADLDLVLGERVAGPNAGGTILLGDDLLSGDSSLIVVVF